MSGIFINSDAWNFWIAKPEQMTAEGIRADVDFYTAGAALGVVQLVHFLPLHLFVTGKHHLCYALTILNDKILGRKVHQYHTHLATVVGIDGSWRVEHCNAPF